MVTKTIDLSWLCFVVLIGVTILVAILGTRSRLRYARRLREAQSRGAFAELNTPKHKSRFRRLAIFALIGMLGMMLSLVILFLQLRTPFAHYYGITLGVTIFFGITGSIAGLLMQREFDRRL
jgi:hypothetical protein